MLPKTTFRTDHSNKELHTKYAFKVSQRPLLFVIVALLHGHSYAFSSSKSCFYNTKGQLLRGKSIYNERSKTHDSDAQKRNQLTHSYLRNRISLRYFQPKNIYWATSRVFSTFCKHSSESFWLTFGATISMPFPFFHIYMVSLVLFYYLCII